MPQIEIDIPRFKKLLIETLIILKEYDRAESLIDDCIKQFKEKLGNKSPILYEIYMKKVEISLLQKKVDLAKDIFLKFAPVYRMQSNTGKWWVFENIVKAAEEIGLSE